MSSIWMSNNEVIGSYRRAVKKSKQVQILAELNGTNKREIAQILFDNGVDKERMMKILKKEENVSNER